LATAGTGDVLAGFIGGLWSQAPLAHSLEIAVQAVAAHGAQADAWTAQHRAGPLLASKLIDALAGRRTD
jgi:NAD(P)H-hydrate repair Nnr-like enzyme with NAD(P)H-hydrate dehydratase domain